MAIDHTQRDHPAPPARSHLRRLDRVFDTTRAPLYFVTVCVRDRLACLANAGVCEILGGAWQDAARVHGWMIGRYVVMPDHVHFFAAPATEASKDLSSFIGKWKQWTQRRIRRSTMASFAWQPEFFDHLMRSSESYVEKWEYVRHNPVRAGLVANPEDWPYQAEIDRLAW